MGICLADLPCNWGKLPCCLAALHLPWPEPWSGAGLLVMTTTDADRLGSTVMVEAHTMISTGGWAPHSLITVQRARLVRAMVESWANSSFCTYNNVTIGGIMSGM